MSLQLNNKTMVVKWLISLIISIIPLFIAQNGIYTAQLQWFLVFTIFGIFLLAFELLNGFAVTLIMTAGWVLSGAATFEAAMSAWTTTNLLTAISAMVLIGILEKTGVLNRLGYWCIVKTGGTFNGLIWGLFFTGIIIMFVGFVLTMVLVFAFAYALYAALELKPEDKESFVIVWTAAISGIFSGVYLYCPITITLVNASVQTVIPDFNLQWYQLIYYNAPMFLFSVLLVWLCLKWYNITNKNSTVNAMKGKEYFVSEYQKLGKMTVDEKKGVFILIVLAVCLFSQPIHNLDSVFAFLIAVILCYLPGINLADNSSVRQIPWDNMFVIGVFLAIGTIATQLGLSGAITGAFIPFISGLGHYWGILGTAILAALVNFVLSPFAMTAVLPGPIVQYCLAAGFEPMAHIATLYLAKEVVFFPYEYPAYLILFAFGMVKMGDMIKICTIKAVLLLIGIMVIMVPYWMLIGLM